MNNTFTRTIIAISFLAAFQAKAWTTTQDAADRLGATQIKEISFSKNSSSLTEEQKAQIRSAVNEAAQKGKIDAIKILAWSDKEYPTTTQDKQSKEDVKLAKNRAGDVRSFLKQDLKISDVDTYNMTERPTALQEFFNTSAAKVKNTTEAAGAAPTDGNTGLFDIKAQASKAVVMIFTKTKN